MTEKIKIKCLGEDPPFYIVKYRCFNKDHTRTWWATDRDKKTGNIVKYYKKEDAEKRAVVLVRVESLPFKFDDILIIKTTERETVGYAKGIRRGSKEEHRRYNNEQRIRKHMFVKRGMPY